MAIFNSYVKLPEGILNGFGPGIFISNSSQGWSRDVMNYVPIEDSHMANMSKILKFMVR